MDIRGFIYIVFGSKEIALAMNETLCRNCHTKVNRKRTNQAALSTPKRFSLDADSEPSLRTTKPN
ncbi:hypothetical protein quinque_016518 [Culex quinquefasciatus]